MRPRAREWAGGRAPMPAYVMEEQPYRPDVILWCEAPEGLIVGHDVVDPHAPVSFADSLRGAMAKPRSMRAESDESYLEDGRIPESAVTRLFRATEILWNVAPWKKVSDDQVL